LQHTSETLAKAHKTLENTCEAIAKHMQHPDETIATYVSNI
jgi:hypothetical protein